MSEPAIPPPRSGFCQIATADVLAVLADALKRSERILVREGFEGDFRSMLEGRFRLQQGCSNPSNPPLASYDDHYVAIRDLFWHFFDQSGKHLRVYDDPEGHA